MDTCPGYGIEEHEVDMLLDGTDGSQGLCPDCRGRLFDEVLAEREVQA